MPALTRTLALPIAVAAALLAASVPPVLAQQADAPAAAPTAAEDAAPVGGSYAFDADHSHIVYAYDHLGFSTSTGMVRGLTGTITLDPDDPARSTIEARFPLSALTTVSANLDRELTGDDLFKGATPDAAITFKSTKVEPGGDTAAKVTGNLTMNGVTKPFTLDVTLTKAGEHPMMKVPAVGFVAHGTLKRSDFGLGAFAPAISDDVDVTIHVEAQKG